MRWKVWPRKAGTTVIESHGDDALIRKATIAGRHSSGVPITGRNVGPECTTAFGRHHIADGVPTDGSDQE